MPTDKMYNDKYNPPDNYEDLDGQMKTFTYIDYSRKIKVFLTKDTPFNARMEFMFNLIEKYNKKDGVLKEYDVEQLSDISYGGIYNECLKLNLNKQENKILCQLKVN